MATANEIARKYGCELNTVCITEHTARSGLGQKQFVVSASIVVLNTVSQEIERVTIYFWSPNGSIRVVEQGGKRYSAATSSANGSHAGYTSFQESQRLGAIDVFTSGIDLQLDSAGKIDNFTLNTAR